ncbi:MAG TPA: XdhC family protein [Candidatus Udaeobacter sp.]|nr:XdhC family protein [Candidatus Udaeobacter sp.]
MKDLYDILREWKRRRGERFALATLVHVEGSSYRRRGARLLICEDGTMVGSLSAGCIEEEVARLASEVLRNGEPTLMSFDTRRRFGCAGKIEILVERADEGFLSDLEQDLTRRRPHVAVTRFLENEFAQQINPPIRFLIVGDGLDNAPLHSLGQLLGWEVIEVVDPIAISVTPDDWTAAIVKSHKYGRDLVALQKLLPLNLRYVGLIGPRKRRDQLLNDLLEMGITINAGFFAPAGIDLGAETPEEIALAIIAEIQRVFAHGSGLSLRERKMSIHASLESGDRPTLSTR